MVQNSYAGEQYFSGNASYIKTCASDGVLLDHYNTSSELRGSNGGDISAGSGADYYDVGIVVGRAHKLLLDTGEDHT
jgi:hypothetical protein